MAWFRKLIHVSTSIGFSSIKQRNLNPSSPFLITSLLRYFSTESTLQTPSPDDHRYTGLGPTKPGEKPRVVILGTGWAGCRLLKDIDTSIYDVVCVSPRNHMVFTPLLASTCVGTLEFRSIAEPIARIQPAISQEPGSFFLLARCKGFDADNHEHFISTESTLESSTTPSSSPNDDEDHCYTGLGPTKPGEKPRLVVLGSGWAGCRLMKDIDTNLYDVICVSPRNHMVFTPLLASTCVGTLEFRSVTEPVARIQPAISREPGCYFFLAYCKGLDGENHVVHCETETDGENTLKPWSFNISYDKLVIAAGAEASTFGIHGVKEHAIFLREVHHAQEIRRKLLLNLMLSDVPGISEEEKQRLLHCVVIGGGPTGVEFSGELSDFILKDVHQRYAHVKDYIHVTLIEANEILSSFDDRLRHYATKQLTKSGVHLVRGIVKEVQQQKIILNDGTEVPYGLLVWSTGVGPSPLTRSLQLPKSPGGRIGVDDWLRVPSMQDVFAIGDCCGFLESTGKPVLPALAQVAERQGKYLGSLLNKIGKGGGGHANCAKEMELGTPFVYRHLGSMATVGSYKALVDLRQSKDAKGLSLTGFVSWFIWRSAYLTRVISWRNRFYVAVNWATTFVFGRDISRI